MESDTAERPLWLTREFLEETLRTRDGFQTAILIDSSVHPAVGKGENYASVIYRVCIKFRLKGSNKLEETRLIIKVMPDNEFVTKFFTELDTFKKETAITGDVIPSMLCLLRKKSTDRIYQQMSAYCYKTKIPNTLILEDLTIVGCKLADRRQQLDLSHSVVALKGLARFHAASVALNSRDPTCLEMFKKETMYQEKNKQVMATFMDSLTSALIGVVEKWQGFEKYSDKIRNVFSTSFDTMAKIVKPEPNEFCVLTHGDCWVNNMLFHYCSDTGEVDGVRFIDFQLSRFASPALDLQYFIFSSPKPQVRSEKMEYMLEVYHKELSDTLQILGEDPEQFTFEQLKKGFEDKALFGFMAACTVLTAVLTDPADAFEMSKIKEDGSGVEVEHLQKPYTGDRFKAVFQELLPYFEKKGLI